MDKNPNIGKESLKKLMNLLAIRLTGKKPKKIDMEDGMSVGKDGDLFEETNINMELDNGEKIEGKTVYIDSLEKMKNFMEEENKRIEEEEKEMEKEYDIWLDEHYNRMGLIDDFKVQFPDVGRFDGAVLTWLEKEVEADDFIWLCSELKKLDDILDDENITNYRICRTQLDELAEDYRRARNNGCCDAYDNIVVNKKTGNKFSIGCNYNHMKLDDL